MRLVEKACYARRAKHDSRSVDLQVAGANHVAHHCTARWDLSPYMATTIARKRSVREPCQSGGKQLESNQPGSG